MEVLPMPGFNILSVQAYGVSRSDGRYYPLLSEEGEQAISTEPDDGTNITYYRASSATVYDLSRKLPRSLISTPSTTISAIVSDCRVALACTEYTKGGTFVGAGAGAAIALAATAVSAARAKKRRQGKVLVGHLRYQWVTRIGASLPTKYGRNSYVSLDYRDGGVPKSLLLAVGWVKPVVVAQDIARRAAAFRLQHDPELPDDQRTALEVLLQAEPLQPTPRDRAYYDLPGALDVASPAARAEG